MFAGIIYSLLAKTAYVSLNLGMLVHITTLVIVGCLSYIALMKEMRTGEVSFVTPFRYTRILFGVGAGVLLFGEKVTSLLILGSVIIVLSGVSLISSQNKYDT